MGHLHYIWGYYGDIYDIILKCTFIKVIVNRRYIMD